MLRFPFKIDNTNTFLLYFLNYILVKVFNETKTY